MPRTPRKQQWTDEACYHVMNRGHNRERIFGDDDDRRQFLRLLVRYQERYAGAQCQTSQGLSARRGSVSDFVFGFSADPGHDLLEINPDLGVRLCFWFHGRSGP